MASKNQVASFTADIFDQGDWISYAVPLVHDVQGQGRVTFYRNLLSWNAQLNGDHIGIEEGKVIITMENPKVGFDIFLFSMSIAHLSNVHRIIYPQVLKEIDRLGLKIKK